MTAMKKNYILPSLRLTAMVAESLMATSDPKVIVNKDTTVDAAEVDVKGTSSYNVWNDDWSE